MDVAPVNSESIYDQWLVIRCQAGEEDALAELVERWRPRLYRHACRLTGNADAAADATQEAWLAIVRGLRRLDDSARFPAWAYRIVTFKCADWTRRRQRDRIAHNHHVDRQRTLDGAEDAPSDASGESGEIARLRSALRQLSGEHRAALSLYYLEELSVAQIAGALNIPQGTVKSRLHFARAHLKAIIERSPA